jgi:hypothetical protein
MTYAKHVDKMRAFRKRPSYNTIVRWSTVARVAVRAARQRTLLCNGGHIAKGKAFTCNGAQTETKIGKVQFFLTLKLPRAVLALG